ncbi:MAG: tRNA uridine-5-carboxymethylaminomethyl(34) synthesis GTPase MnmE [Proteobacteria bacterium]|nr:tRNA uridine-5-carboxymethylaminomethyl(34) synthesis GTPase MnmE [Pseudomonadota bacterium]
MITGHNDTIAGIATAPGAAGISIIRISGDSAISIAGSIFRAKNRKNVPEIKNRSFTYGWVEKNGDAIDEAMLCIMRKPASFTAEDVVEIHCHGGLFITRTILDLILESGARLADPGEFTQRAFINGRIDLTQAEATNDMIRARSALGLDLVVNQLKGKLHDRIVSIKDEISWILSLVNANIDFPEEDVVFSNIRQIKEKLDSARKKLTKLINSADTGIKIREGYKIVLTGNPNVGKSSILNGLLEESRSIVHQVPGTTRDTIEESCTIEGIPVSLIDTAGIHETGDVVEKEGIARALSALKTADLILWVIDMTAPSFEIELPEQIDISRVPIVLVLNKKDLSPNSNIPIPDRWRTKRTITISAIMDQDIHRLRKEIFDCISGRSGKLVEDTMLTNLRQKKSTEKALIKLNNAQNSIEQAMGEEFLAVDLSQTLHALGEIVGETTPDDMLNQIFSQFCIGK